jgi:hypothetical protein
MKELLREAIFEPYVEPPEYPPTLRLLYRLAEFPESRWAVFSGYENYPWLIRSHARRYSRVITESECKSWLIEKGYGSLTDAEIEKKCRSREDFDYW